MSGSGKQLPSTTHAGGKKLPSTAHAAGGRGKTWCFTLNNYTSDEVDMLSQIVDTNDTCVYIIFGKEVGESGTPHLQGVIAFSKRIYLSELKKLVSKTAHFELAREVKNACTYCKKDGDWVEFGVFPATQGKRTDIDAFKADVQAGVYDLKELREKHSIVLAKYKQFSMEYVMDHKPLRKIPFYPLHDWQKELLGKLDAEPDDRTIVFVVDVSGNNGKSWFAQWYEQTHPDCQLITPGKKADMAFNLKDDIRTLILDCPRSKQGDFIQYDFLEEVKNRVIFSPKYESRTKRLPMVHLVVMMNECPDMSKLSHDRYDVLYLD